MVRKYKNRKLTIDGEVFDSQKEARRYRELAALQRAGQISDLKRQVRYELIPTQRIGSKVVEKSCVYIADFVYTENGETVVEDTKGFKTPEYRIKKKLLLYVHGIQIRET